MNGNTRKFAGFVLVLLAAAATVSAQLNVHWISSRSLSKGVRVPTRIDTVLVETEVAAGVARTSMTLVLNPGSYYTQTYNGSSRDYTWSAAQAVDSVEMTASFNLPTDFVAKEMYLWIDGQKERAYIQDRALAWQQYAATVGVRIDPALLQFNGNGSYHLRIFPAATGMARKIEIQFEHTFDDDSAGVISAMIPIAFDSSYSYYYAPESGRRPVGYMRVRLHSADGHEYSFAMPGLGSGKFSSSILTLEKHDIYSLRPGTISKADPSGNDEYMWTAGDKNNALTLGFSVMLAESTVELEDEPETRVIVLDVRDTSWNWNDYYELQYDYMYGDEYTYRPYSGYEAVNLWRRARKYAVMCLKNYVDKGQKFNLVIAGNSVTKVFSAPVAPTSENLATAFAAIVSASADPRASTQAAMEEAVDQADGDIVILISDLYPPHNYNTRICTDNRCVYEVSSAGTTYNEKLDSLSSLIHDAGITLFTIEDDYRLSSIARETGGFRLGSLRYEYYYAYEPYVLDGVEKYRPVMPRLFLDNYMGITSIEVESDQVVDIVHSRDGYSYSWWGWGVMPEVDGIAVRSDALAKSSRLSMPYYYGANQCLLRVAGKMDPTRSNPNVSFTIRGKMGGLGFSKTVSGAIYPGGSFSDSPLWAFRKTEHLVADDWYSNTDSVKAIGMEYHIVTRQTSLLALEPDDTLWTDTSSNSAQNSGGEREAATSDMVAAPNEYGTNASGQSIDDMSLEELIAGDTPVRNSGNNTLKAQLSVRATRDGITVFVPDHVSSQTLELVLYDLRGKLLAAKTIERHRIKTGRFLWDVGEGGVHLSNANYLVRLKAGNVNKMFRVSVLK